MKRFEACLKHKKQDHLIYKFDKCISEQGCDYVIFIISSTKLIIAECKKGNLGIGDFEDAKNQIGHTVRFFDKHSCKIELIVICYERAKPLVLRHANNLLRKPYRGRIRILLQQFRRSSLCNLLC